MRALRALIWACSASLVLFNSSREAGSAFNKRTVSFCSALTAWPASLLKPAEYTDVI